MGDTVHQWGPRLALERANALRAKLTGDTNDTETTIQTRG
jgi:hypothetical protein